MSKDFHPLTAKEVIKVLERIGYSFHRQKGSHGVYYKDASMVIVPIHSGQLKPGTLRQIIKSTGLSTAEFYQHI